MAELVSFADAPVDCGERDPAISVHGRGFYRHFRAVHQLQPLPDRRHAIGSIISPALAGLPPTKKALRISPQGLHCITWILSATRRDRLLHPSSSASWCRYARG